MLSNNVHSALVDVASASSTNDVPAWLLSALQKPLPVREKPPPPPAPPPGDTLTERVVYLSQRFAKEEREQAAEHHAQRSDLEAAFCTMFAMIEIEEEESRAEQMLLAQLLEESSSEMMCSAAINKGADDHDVGGSPIDADGTGLEGDRDRRSQQQEKEGDGEEDVEQQAQSVHYCSKQATRMVQYNVEQKKMEDFQRSRQCGPTDDMGADDGDGGDGAASNFQDCAALRKYKEYELKLCDPLLAALEQLQNNDEHSAATIRKAAGPLLLSLRELAELKKKKRLLQMNNNSSPGESRPGSAAATTTPNVRYRDFLRRPASESGITPVPSETLTRWVSGSHPSSNTSSRNNNDQSGVASPETSPVFLSARRTAQVAASTPGKEGTAAAVSASQYAQRSQMMLAMHSADTNVAAAHEEREECAVRPSSAFDLHRFKKVLPPASLLKLQETATSRQAADSSLLPLPSALRRQFQQPK